MGWGRTGYSFHTPLTAIPRWPKKDREKNSFKMKVYLLLNYVIIMIIIYFINLKINISQFSCFKNKFIDL